MSTTAPKSRMDKTDEAVIVAYPSEPTDAHKPTDEVMAKSSPLLPLPPKEGMRKSIVPEVFDPSRLPTV